MVLLICFAFLAGIATTLSPCVIPVLPAILASGTAKGRFRRLGILLGLLLSFTIFTLTLNAILNITGISPNFFRYLAIVVVAVFGLLMIFPTLGDHFAQKTSGISELGSKIQASATTKTGFTSGFILGIALGLIWTPCAGPILGAVIAISATNPLSLKLLVITLSYALGSCLVMLLIMAGGNKAINSSRFLSKHAEMIRRGFGLLMVATALALYFHIDTKLQQMTLDYFPSINIENNSYVNQELEKLRGPTQSLNQQSQMPPFKGAVHWINSPPLSPETLKGKVVLVDFWTYSCINCIRTFPYLKKWEEKYSPNGLVIVGVHTPEFAFEKDIHNVEDAVKRFGLKYPIAMDNNYAIWNAYSNQYWPAHYLFNQKGQLVETHFGEGAYLETENAIRQLLGLEALKTTEQPTPSLPLTPETYLGYDRAERYSNELTIHPDAIYDYSFHSPLLQDQVGLSGLWRIDSEYIVSESNTSLLSLHFEASHVYLVMSSEDSDHAYIEVQLDGKPLRTSNFTSDMNTKGQIMVNKPRKYDVVNVPLDSRNHTLMLKVPKGTKLYAFTFG